MKHLIEYQNHEKPERHTSDQAGDQASDKLANKACPHVIKTKLYQPPATITRPPGTIPVSRQDAASKGLAMTPLTHNGYSKDSTQQDASFNGTIITFTYVLNWNSVWWFYSIRVLH